jgi:hypothetical protein
MPTFPIRRWRNFHWSLVWLLLPLALLIPALNGFAYPDPAARFSDLTITHYPNVLYLRQAVLGEGRLPLWSPNILSGAPFTANPLAGVWYPPGWLTLLLPLPLGFNLVIGLHLLWGGLGMYGLLRAEGLVSAAALFGALAFGFLPKLFAHYGAGHLTLLYAVPWTPWLLWAARERLNGRCRAGFCAWEALAFALLVLADVRWAAYAGILWWGYSLAYTPLRRWPGQILHQLGQSLLAVLLAAPLLFPLAELTRLSSRAVMTAQDALAFSLPPARLLGLLFPDFGGFHEYILYAGQVVLALSLLLLIRAVRHPAGNFWVWTALLALALALGSYLPPLAWLARLPVLDLLRAPARWLFVAGMALAASAACSLDILLGSPAGLRPRRAGLALTALAGFSLALTAGIWAISGHTPLNFAWGAGFILAGVLWIGLYLGGRIPSKAWLVGLFVLGILDWAGIDRTLFAPRSLEQVLAEGKLAAEYLAAQTGEFRIYSPSYSIPQHTAAMAGLQLADGVDPLQLASYVAFMQPATGVPDTGYSVTVPPFVNGDPASANAAYRPDAALLGLLNVRYVTSEFDLPVEGLQLEQQFGATRLYRNLMAAPRAWLQPLDSAAAPMLPPELVQVSPERIEIRSQGPGLLVLSEINFPGWQVWVDGVSQPVETYNGLLRAVRLSSGDHRVVFAFRSASLCLGLAGFILAGLYLLVAAWFERRANRLRQASAQEMGA